MASTRMKSLRSCLVSLAFVLLASHAAAADSPPPNARVVWREWSPEIFAQAKRENKFVLLDLAAVWCHWCHVMEETTYRDPAVVALLDQRYITVRVDQDSRPDLSNRYEDYGWPATVVFAADGSEIVKRQGYLPPDVMAGMLQAIIDDPSPGPSVMANPGPVAVSAVGGTLSAERRAGLLQAWRNGYDDKDGGWAFGKKFLDWDCVELGLRQAAGGDAQAAHRARDTLRLQRKLLDPVWGGVYQYSQGDGWNQPHFEKIMQMQAENLRIYAQAYAQWGDAADLATAQAIHHYLRTFLTSPEGVVYTSQDADLVPGEHGGEYFALDDAGRRARGVPRVDQHVYARENGWVISALVRLAEATGDRRYRDEAVRAARWVIAHRALPDGGYRHDDQDVAGPYLGDTLAMGRAFLALHEVTQEPEWLDRATAAAAFIETHFRRGEQPGYATSDLLHATPPLPQPQFDENAGLARFGAALSRVTGKADYRAIADRALRWCLAPEVADRRGAYVAAALLAELELRTEPVHVMILGSRDDAAAQTMFAAALRLPEQHKLVEWWDRRQGPAPRGEDYFPDLGQAAAFLCANGACSTPITSPEALQRRLTKLAQQ